MKILALISVILIAGCAAPQEKFELAFYKWSIHEYYLLKINSSDTIYIIKNFPQERKVSFAIINNNDRKLIDRMLDTISFPKEDFFENEAIADGITYSFNYRSQKTEQRLIIQTGTGPNQFWLLGRLLEKIKNQYNFIDTKTELDSTEIDKIPQYKIRLPKEY